MRGMQAPPSAALTTCDHYSGPTRPGPWGAPLEGLLAEAITTMFYRGHLLRVSML